MRQRLQWLATLVVVAVILALQPPAAPAAAQATDPPAIVPGAVTVNEGNGGITPALVPVTLTRSSTSTVTAQYETVPLSAASPEDFTARTGTLTFVPGDNSELIPIQVKGDRMHEGDELFAVRVHTASNADVGGFGGHGFVFVTNDDAVPVATPGHVTVTEGHAGTTDAVVPITLDRPNDKPVTVEYVTLDHTAVAPADYVPASGTLTFAPGETEKSVTVQVNGDTDPEPSEVALLSLRNATNATIGGFFGLGLISITEDDPPPVITPGSVRVEEGNSGTTAATVPISLDRPSSTPITLEYVTIDNSAMAPGDYAPASGTVTFAPGQTEQSVTIQVNGDTVREQDELALVSFRNPSFGTLAGFFGLGFVHITNDDNQPSGLGFQIDVTQGAPGATVNGQVDPQDVADLCATDVETVQDRFQAFALVASAEAMDRYPNGIESVFPPGSQPPLPTETLVEFWAWSFYTLIGGGVTDDPAVAEQVLPQLFVMTFADIATQTPIGELGSFDPATGVGSVTVPDVDPGLLAVAAACVMPSADLAVIEAGVAATTDLWMEQFDLPETMTQENIQQVNQALEEGLMGGPCDDCAIEDAVLNWAPTLLSKILYFDALGVQLFTVLPPP
jgi:hypothetical protein